MAEKIEKFQLTEEDLEKVVGGTEGFQSESWYLSQCDSCGRCHEPCQARINYIRSTTESGEKKILAVVDLYCYHMSQCWYGPHKAYP